MRNENESTTATHNNMDAFHKHTIDQVSQIQKDYILYDSIDV